MSDEPVVLLLAPSRGLGGGIERYLRGVESALRDGGAQVRRIDLAGPSVRARGGRAKVGFAAAAMRAARQRPRPDCVLAGHPGLAPVAVAAARCAGGARCRVVFHGVDIFRGRPVTRRIMGRPGAGAAPLAVSGFGAGAVAATGCGLAAVVPPALERDWADALAAARLNEPRAPLVDEGDRPPTLLTVARLDQWRGKGIGVLGEAMTTVRREVGPVRLVVAGRGPAPDGLRAALAPVAGVNLVESPTDSELAALYARSDLFVLASRTSVVPPRSGEGFGIVLLEAQAAGCPVVGPAHGGSRDAYREGVTGWTPADESPAALAAVLVSLLTRRSWLEKARDEAANWGGTYVAGESYVRHVRRVVVGRPG